MAACLQLCCRDTRLSSVVVDIQRLTSCLLQHGSELGSNSQGFVGFCCSSCVLGPFRTRLEPAARSPVGVSFPFISYNDQTARGHHQTSHEPPLLGCVQNTGAENLELASNQKQGRDEQQKHRKEEEAKTRWLDRRSSFGAQQKNLYGF